MNPTTFMITFTRNQRYHRRRDIHQQFGGQQQGGISTPQNHPFIFIFTGDMGEQYGYKDGWTQDGIYLYTGEGQIGDMQFIRGNAAIRDHATNGKDLLLFKYVDQGVVEFVGQMIATGSLYRQAPDRDGNNRRVIVFELSPFETYKEPDASEIEVEEIQNKLTLEELRQKAKSAATMGGTPKERMINTYQRSAAIKAYVRKRANGICEGCQQPAPFLTPNHIPYLEAHHIRRLSDGGPDDPAWVAALCPNCHSRAHHASDAKQFNQQLELMAHQKEKN